MSARARPRLALAAGGSEGGGEDDVEAQLVAVVEQTNADAAYAVARHGHLIALHAPSTSPFGEGVDISAAAELGDVAGNLINRDVVLVDPHTAVCLCGNVAVLFVVNPKPYGAHQRARVFATAERIGVLIAEHDVLREPWTIPVLTSLLDQK